MLAGAFDQDVTTFRIGPDHGNTQALSLTWRKPERFKESVYAFGVAANASADATRSRNKDCVKRNIAAILARSAFVIALLSKVSF